MKLPKHIPKSHPHCCPPTCLSFVSSSTKREERWNSCWCSTVNRKQRRQRQPLYIPCLIQWNRLIQVLRQLQKHQFVPFCYYTKVNGKKPQLKPHIRSPEFTVTGLLLHLNTCSYCSTSAEWSSKRIRKLLSSCTSVPL